MYEIPQISFGVCSEISCHLFSFLAVKKGALVLPYFALPTSVSITGYYHNNRSSHNEINRNLIASTETLWY